MEEENVEWLRENKVEQPIFLKVLKPIEVVLF
ncbi:hypothetical protein G3A_02890 [Bacillus sp. 17376]|nr:hypothetical protein G3A_02890 [Bacillus sp. 17376]